MGRPLRHSSPAFTLIELMVVIVLIGVLTAMILPEMKGTYGDALLRSTSRELVSVCDLASSHAVSINQPLVLRFEPKTGRYSVEPLSRRRSSPPREIPGGQGQLDTRISIDFHPPQDQPGETPVPEPTPAPASEPEAVAENQGITFYPDGTADAVEILLRDQDGFRLALRINPVTARVRIIELARQ